VGVFFFSLCFSPQLDPASPPRPGCPRPRPPCYPPFPLLLKSHSTSDAPPGRFFFCCRCFALLKNSRSRNAGVLVFPVPFPKTPLPLLFFPPVYTSGTRLRRSFCCSSFRPAFRGAKKNETVCVSAFFALFFLFFFSPPNPPISLVFLCCVFFIEGAHALFFFG